MISTFKRLSPKQKQMLAVGGAIGGAMLIVTVAMTGQEATSSGSGADRDIRYVLTDRDSRDVTMDSLATQLTAAQRENKELRERFDRLQAEVTAESQSGIPSSVTRELDSLSRQIDLLREENRDLRNRTENLDLTAVAQMQPSEDTESESPSSPDDTQLELNTDTTAPNEPQPSDQAVPTFNDESEPLTSESVFQERPVQRRVTPESQQQSGDGEGEGEEQAPGLSITTYYQENHPDEQATGGEEEAPVYLPSGSIVSGVLLNGIDAPTGQGARRDPFPVTVRVKHEAILPNHFSADIKECFLLVSGHGDLSTERAYLRGNNISCMTDDGDVIETELRGYAVGEDGKAGIRGRLVSKQGAMIARSMVAGFFSGAAGAFDVSPIPVIDTQNVDGRDRYQSNYDSDLLEGAGAQGAGQALERIAEFYIQMAEDIFPVVEVDSGREVDVILTQGLSMQTKNVEEE
ncbi:TrbI/VirB10 family protein [Vreelandella massiliensis]|uniref:TrbI/VirB10 family protein n=1 Tax=Vreelandella massiliensis TaxID=1816686 RepID=UPI00096ABD02|nr:TrbI/VirB10 family protein [Halomonas massiliensis]